jgi:hypothetical protein
LCYGSHARSDCRGYSVTTYSNDAQQTSAKIAS